jgi:hypothetical protein
MQAQLFRRIDAGQTAENGITVDSSERKGPGCRTNHGAGLKESGATVPNMWQSGCCRLKEHRRRASPWAVPVMRGVSCIPSRLLSYCFEKPLGIKRRPPFQHGVHGAPELLGEDRQGFGFAVAADQSLMIEFGRQIFSKEQAGCLAECPFEMDVADLVVWAGPALASRFMGAFHQPSVGKEVSHCGEAVDVVDFVEDDQGQGFSDTRDAA